MQDAKASPSFRRWVRNVLGLLTSAVALAGRNRRASLVIFFLALNAPALAEQRTFVAGSLIVPMDLAYQDRGHLQAYGLVYQLLSQGVKVHWAIDPDKTYHPTACNTPGNLCAWDCAIAGSGVKCPYPTASPDFTAASQVLWSDTGAMAQGTAISSHGYRGGPFVVDAADRGAALAIVNSWNTGVPSRPLFIPVTVHEATAAFIAPVARTLITAPPIAILATGNQDGVFAYLNAAGIPGANGSIWSSASPGLLQPADVAGPSSANHRDGRLFTSTGLPAYCQLAIPHWNVIRNSTNDEAIAEIAEFLKYPTHVFAASDAASIVETSRFGHFLTTDNGTGEPAVRNACAAPSLPNNGLCVAPNPASVSHLHAGLPFAQIDGAFGLIGGSAPAFGLAPGSTYRDPGMVMLRSSGANSDGIADVWITGYAGGGCQMSTATETPQCAGVGKTSYLGGLAYTTSIPVSANPSSQGAKLFLQSLFEARCTASVTRGRTDFNNDGKSDILYRNNSTGQVYRLLMSGFGVANASMAYTEPNTAWKVIADADFDGDGVSDLLWRNTATGQVFIQPFAASGLPVGGTVFYTEPSSAWKIVHTPDLDGDGRADLLWYNTATGQVYAMLMNGAAIKAQGMVYTEPNTAWSIVVVGDFAGSGKANQLAWRNSVTGQLYLMTVSYAGGVFSQSGAMIYAEPNTAWKVIGAPDLDGDGRSDLLWRNDATGQVYGMLMNGGAIASQGMIYTEPNLAWKIVAQGDYNGDGKADLLYRNESTGQVYMMLMSGLAVANAGLVYGEPNTLWKVLGPYEYALN